ncbi:glycosyltransferase family 4 protein [Prevotella copri]|jgi:glycosyltransferase|uniref:glycosyltransferase family 4 protein n=1 Tax=Segatella copri TaxID=165179 RepID=UPI001C3882A9|nr:glycosyltransferase family 4 protein [Segatella copri]MBV3402603.1 glycosyltransferase family 4 protein [Segatella copri]
MKILIVKDVPGEIKAQRMTYNIQELGLAVALRKLGHECDVMSISDKNQFSKNEISIDNQKITIYSVKAFVAFKNGWLKGVDEIFDRYDILHVCEYNQIFTWYLAKKYQHKMICYHGPYYCDFNHNYNKMAKVFDMFFVDRYRKLNTSFITKSGLAKKYLNSKGLNNVHSVGVGLSTSFLHNITNEELPELTPIKELTCLKLLYIGVIEPRRNSLFLLDILKELKKKGVNFKLIMIGRYKNEAYKKVFNARVHELELSDSIYYIPRVEQKYLSQVYANTDIFLLPTIYDIYGMVLLESMYFGMPTITSVNGGSNMMIEDGTNGFIISKFEAKVWADKVIELSEDKKYCEKIGDAAHKTIIEKYTWDKLASKFIDIYTVKLKEG